MSGPAPVETRLLSGWGRTSPTAARVVRPRDESEVVAVLSARDGDAVDPVGAPPRVITRGLGRSYGDAAQRAGGTVIDASGFADMVFVDPRSGLVEVGAGVSLDELMRWALPRGWFVPVSPGTRLVTVGGAIAADIHGKNHHRDGSFTRHVERLTLVTPTGTHEIGPSRDPELFWATAGGMGLTGVVTRATLRLIPVETSWFTVDTDRTTDLDSLMAAMERADAHYRYSVAWVDCMGRRSRFGRGILSCGDHAPLEALGPSERRRPLTPPAGARVRVPLPAPRRLLNMATISAFNEAWFRRAPRHEVGALQTASSFLHPLDGVSDWNLLYGSPGFLQYQFVVGPAQGEAVVRAVTMLSDSRVPSFFAVLKRFGAASPGPLSFPMEGWTLALDFPLGPEALPPLLDALDRLVVDAGGRVYLAKDSRLQPDLLGAMYPRLAEFGAARARVDPDGVLGSDLSQRLGLDRGPDTTGGHRT